MARTTSEDAKKQSDLRYVFVKILFIYFFRERRREGEKRGRETSMFGCLSHALTRDLD